MKEASSIRQMLAGNIIFVPTYQRAYSWETETDPVKPGKHTNVFFSDLEDYIKSKTNTPYYFGHFLFEEKDSNHFGVIDGQQRLSTIQIFLSALFTRLIALRPLKQEENKSLEDLIKDRTGYRFSTVDYDNQLFIDYVIDQTKLDKDNLDTTSSKRIVKAFDFFLKALFQKDEAFLLKLLDTVQSASCSTHTVTDEAEAIQMFIFQNNRGKKPSNLEILKAEFMFNIHLYGGDEKDALIKEVKRRFQKIYESISSIEYKIKEDDVLVYTLRVHFNSLWESNAIEKINKILSEGNPIKFIKEFTHSLAISFEKLKTFFGDDEKEYVEIHSLVTLGGIAVALPFIIKAYRFGIPKSEICRLCASLESLVLRHRLIGTRAELTSRINGVFAEFTKENTFVQPIINRINFMKSTNDWWWAYWNDSELQKAIQGGMQPLTAKYLLWKYENHLEGQGKNGYTPTRFDKIEKPELEHIAPQTEKPEAGYCEYDDEFRQKYLNSLGNYLLLSKSHNCSVGNKPFKEKRNSYNHLSQQREIQEMTEGTEQWTKEKINERKAKISEFVLNSL